MLMSFDDYWFFFCLLSASYCFPFIALDLVSCIVCIIVPCVFHISCRIMTLLSRIATYTMLNIRHNRCPLPF
jgi:hypothetical protein